ncbi:MAG: tRNA (adenosine(37)-N6)-threonylcarbamoyltransferase complex dimerization subunit type 1 TsaB [Candidatus Eremiobacteraeota bacterium]|nr:tRNA (adenosine(37)-N6)-threonylcarbamoyltransferase complex dimerization subunit type 1 TsaB [Candidatus Eremiobacteraeota bacterium]
MIVLGLDGALGNFSVALDGEGAVRETLVSTKMALEQGLAAVSRCMAEGGVTPRQIDRIGVGIGPGTFTGLRIAIAFAKSLAAAWRTPLCGVSSFDALEAAYAGNEPRLCVVRGRTGVISARYTSGGVCVRASGYIASVLEELAPAFQGVSLAVFGAAEDVLAALGERGQQVHCVQPAYPTPARAIARVAAAREPARSVHEIRADYGELPAARVPKTL